MRIWILTLPVVLLLAIASAADTRAGQDQKQPAEGAKEEIVEAYESQTNGALLVSVDRKDPKDSFDVLRDGKRASTGAPKLLNSTLELTPGTYVVDVNRTQRNVNIMAGKKTTLWTGELLVEGKPETMAWYAMQGNVKLSNSGVEPLLNNAIPLFAGTYTVFVDTSLTGPDKSLGRAEVKAGRKTVLKN